MNSSGSSYAMYRAWIVCLSGCPTTCTVTGTMPRTFNLIWLATLMMLVVGHSCFSSTPMRLMMLFPAQRTEVPVSATPTAFIYFALSGSCEVLLVSLAQCSSCGLIITCRRFASSSEISVFHCAFLSETKQISNDAMFG